MPPNWPRLQQHKLIVRLAQESAGNTRLMGSRIQKGMAGAILFRSAGLGVPPLGTPPSPVGRLGGYAAQPSKRVCEIKAVKRY